MQTDLYTKAVLTVIALALSAIAVQHTIPSAFAQTNGQPIKVLICDPIWRADDRNCASVSSGEIKIRKF